jgi:hypothetical protein
MILQAFLLAFALQVAGANTAFPDGAPSVVRVERDSPDRPSKRIKVDKNLRKRIEAALAGGESELGVFLGDYTITVIYQHKRESVYVTDQYFRFKGASYVMKEDVGAMLSQIPKQPASDTK